MKRLVSLMLVCVLLMACVPSAMAKMDDVPVWDEETVRQYVEDYVSGKSMDRLYSYFDLQIRRYMPNETYESLLIDLQWMTGDFIALGSYRQFSEPELELKTHVIHLCMEKQDLELYFTHKDKEDDWEVMALEFVPADKEVVESNDHMLVGEEGEYTIGYTEEEVTVGSEKYPLQGLLAMPDSASEGPVPACVLVHDLGALDRDMTQGQTKLFRDIAKVMAQMDIATLRYDKRSYTYPDAVIETVEDDVIQDVLSAVELLSQDPRIDSERIVVVGVGFGAMVAPRIAVEAEGMVKGLILIGGTTDTLLEKEYAASAEKNSELRDTVRGLARMKEEKVRELTLFGRNGYYYWEMETTRHIDKFKNMKIPTYIVEGGNDPTLTENNGWKSYREMFGTTVYTYETFRNLNHLLMNDLTNDLTYSAEAVLDPYAGLNLAQWVLTMND